MKKKKKIKKNLSHISRHLSVVCVSLIVADFESQIKIIGVGRFSSTSTRSVPEKSHWLHGAMAPVKRLARTRRVGSSRCTIVAPAESGRFGRGHRRTLARRRYITLPALLSSSGGKMSFQEYDERTATAEQSIINGPQEGRWSSAPTGF